MPGKLIVIDGIDGSGKTEQINRLSAALEFAGLTVANFKFPVWSSLSGELIQKFENEKKSTLSAETLATLYATNFLESREELRKSLEAGKIVVCQRYGAANRSHHAMNFTFKEERVQFYKWLDRMEYETFGLPKADLTVILDISETLASKNLRKMGKKHDKASLNYLEKCRKIYLELAELMPRTQLVECSKAGEMLDAETIHNKVWEIVRRLVLHTLP